MASTIERRFRRELRERGFDPETRVGLIDTGTVELLVVERLLRSVFGDRVTVERLPVSTRRRKNVYRPSSLENELVEGLRSFLEDRDDTRRFTPLLATVPEAEILGFARRHRLRGGPIAPKDGVRALLEELQERQPQTKPSLRKSLAWLRRAATRPGTIP